MDEEKINKYDNIFELDIEDDSENISIHSNPEFLVRRIDYRMIIEPIEKEVDDFVEYRKTFDELKKTKLNQSVCDYSNNHGEKFVRYFCGKGLLLKHNFVLYTSNQIRIESMLKVFYGINLHNTSDGRMNFSLSNYLSIALFFNLFCLSFETYNHAQNSIAITIQANNVEQILEMPNSNGSFIVSIKGIRLDETYFHHNIYFENNNDNVNIDLGYILGGQKLEICVDTKENLQSCRTIEIGSLGLE